MLVVVWGRGSAQTVRTAFPSGTKGSNRWTSPLVRPARTYGSRRAATRKPCARCTRRTSRRLSPSTPSRPRAPNSPRAWPTRWSTIRASSSSRTGASSGSRTHTPKPAGRPIGGMRSSRCTSNKARPGAAGDAHCTARYWNCCARRARRSRSSHSVATWSRGSLVPSGRPKPQERMKRSTSMERGFTNKSGCTPSASAAHTPS